MGGDALARSGSSPRANPPATSTGSPPPVGSRDLHSRNVALERRLARAIAGEVRFDAASRGRYATDASIYQIMPAGVVLPRRADDLDAVLQIAREEGVPVIMRGAGTSQNGQPIGAGLVVDCSRHLGEVLAYDRAERRVTVRPGLVLEHLNARLKPDGLFFPVEPSTASRCTIGGMTGNNSCGARSLRYGRMAENVEAIDALLADGSRCRFDRASEDALAWRLLALAERERDEIAARFPKVQRRVGGYNLDSLILPSPNLAHLLVGSEGTLAAFTQITLALSPLPAHRVMGVAHFPTFRRAMEMTRFLVELGPTAVELVDHNVLALGADIPLFQRTLADITRGRPDCLLLVEFAGDDQAALGRDLKRLEACMSDHGLPGAVVEVAEPARQRQVWEMREACLNIMMSMKGDAKPVSFIEDCAVPLEHLADYTAAISELFQTNGTRGTWYAHASVGCLHVRPILDMKDAGDLARMRRIAEAACDLVKRFKGSYSGEHGDGLSRSEFIRPMFGDRLTAAFEAVKDAFDPAGLLNPGKIVRAPRFDDRSLLRFPAGYRVREPARPALDWSEHGSFGAAVEMCNNNGTCRKTMAGVMCPSYRATGEEEHVTRGRANTLRLAISGELGAAGIASPEVKAALDLCVSCKACRRECPTGVDMARMKIEALAHHHARHGLPLRERLVAGLPRYARLGAVLGPLLNLRDRVPGLAWLSERLTRLAADRPLPVWRRPWQEIGPIAAPDDIIGDGRDVVLFGDTFNRYFEPQNLLAAERVLERLGYRLHRVLPADRGRPLCCGRTFLSVGDVGAAAAEIARSLETLAPFVDAGAQVIGLEPSCTLTFRDEALAVPLAGPAGLGQARAALARSSRLIEELITSDLKAGRLALHSPAGSGREIRRIHLHTHCHQKAAGIAGGVEAVLKAAPGIEVRPIDAGCCGMAGAFGYHGEHVAVSRAIGELALAPAVRAAGADDLIAADGTSCRHQIADLTDREALHVVRILDQLGVAGTWP
jgi:FAD/FMN-containing dehydrogenase/Fe-S oxidoreductase